MADITKIKILENGVETVKEIGVSTPIKNELDKKIDTLTLSVQSPVQIIYELLLKVSRGEILTDKVYVVNGVFHTTIFTNGTKYMVHMDNIHRQTSYIMKYYMEVSDDLTPNAINYTTYEYQKKLTAGDGVNISEDNVISINPNSFIKNVTLSGGGPDSYIQSALNYFFENRANSYAMNFIVNNNYHCYIAYTGNGYTCKLVDLMNMSVFYNNNPVNEGFTYDDMDYKSETIGGSGGKTYYKHHINMATADIGSFTFEIINSNNQPYTLDTLKEYVLNNNLLLGLSNSLYTPASFSISYDEELDYIIVCVEQPDGIEITWTYVDDYDWEIEDTITEL